jgi:hypothetical protein
LIFPGMAKLKSSHLCWELFFVGMFGKIWDFKNALLSSRKKRIVVKVTFLYANYFDIVV